MPKQGLFRVTLPRAPRGLRRASASRATVRPLGRPPKRAVKRGALRDCSHRCAYCGTRLDVDTATLDHVYPSSKGGPNLSGNLVAACGTCNRMKGDLLPAEFFARYPWAGVNFMRYARCVHRALKRTARRAVSLGYAMADAA